MRDGWGTVPLGDLCTLTKGAYPTEKTKPGPYLLVVTAGSFRTADSYQLEGEAVCIPTISSTGHGHASLKRVHYVRGKFAVANLLMAAQPRPEALIDARWLWLYLDHRRDELIVPLMQGTANVNLKPSQLGSIPVDLPPLAEQRRIVDLIAAVDAAVTAGRRMASTAKEALMEASLAATTPEACPSTARLADVAAILDARRVPVSEAERNRRLGSIPYYGANGRVGWIDRPLFNEPLVLLAEDGGYYDEWRTRPVAYEIDGPAWVNNHAHILRAAAIPHDWLYFSLRHRDLTPIVNVGTRAKLNQAPLRDIPIGIVQDPVAACRPLRALHDVALAADLEVTALAQSRTALLGSLLEGRREIPLSYDRFLDGAA